MTRVLIILSLLAAWLSSVLSTDMDLLWLVRHVIWVLLVFKVALVLDDLQWFITFTEKSILRQIRKMK